VQQVKDGLGDYFVRKRKAAQVCVIKHWVGSQSVERRGEVVSINLYIEHCTLLSFLFYYVHCTLNTVHMVHCKVFTVHYSL